VAGGWDPAEAPRPFQHLAAWVKEEKLDEPFFFSTHPRLEERIESVSALLKTRYAGRRGGEVGAARYRTAVREVVLGAARLDLAAGRFTAAERGARDYLELVPRSAAAWAFLGDVARQRGEADEALARYRKAVALDPACAEGQRGLGQALARRGDHAAARAALSAYLRLRPDAVDKAWIDAELERLPRSGR
jgi:predicted Zn-dependent protease